MVSVNDLPKYFIVEGVPVMVVLEGDEVAGYTSNGREFPPLKAANEGKEVSLEEYNAAASKLSAQD